MSDLIASTTIKGLEPVDLEFLNGEYVVTYGDFTEAFDSVDEAFDFYKKQIEIAYDDYR